MIERNNNNETVNITKLVKRLIAAKSLHPADLNALLEDPSQFIAYADQFSLEASEINISAIIALFDKLHWQSVYPISLASLGSDDLQVIAENKDKLLEFFELFTPFITIDLNKENNEFLSVNKNLSAEEASACACVVKDWDSHEAEPALKAWKEDKVSKSQKAKLEAQVSTKDHSHLEMVLQRKIKANLSIAGKAQLGILKESDQHVLSAVDIKDFLSAVGINNVHTAAFNEKEIGMILHQERVKHEGSLDAYSIYIMTNFTDISDPENHVTYWTALKVTVDPATKSVEIEYIDPTELDPEKKFHSKPLEKRDHVRASEKEDRIKAILNKALNFEVRSAGNPDEIIYSAFKNMDNKQVNISCIGMQSTTWTLGYYLLQGIVAEFFEGREEECDELIQYFIDPENESMKINTLRKIVFGIIVKNMKEPLIMRTHREDNAVETSKEKNETSAVVEESISPSEVTDAVTSVEPTVEQSANVTLDKKVVTIDDIIVDLLDEQRTIDSMLGEFMKESLELQLQKYIDKLTTSDKSSTQIYTLFVPESNRRRLLAAFALRSVMNGADKNVLDTYHQELNDVRDNLHAIYNGWLELTGTQTTSNEMQIAKNM